MVLFSTHNVDVYEEVRDAGICGIDDYGAPKKCKTIIASTVGDLQQDGARDSIEEYGKANQSTYTLILDTDVTITKTSRIYAYPIGKPEQASFYTVIGNIGRWTEHLEVSLVEDR